MQVELSSGTSWHGKSEVRPSPLHPLPGFTKSIGHRKYHIRKNISRPLLGEGERVRGTGRWRSAINRRESPTRKSRRRRAETLVPRDFALASRQRAERFSVSPRTQFCAPAAVAGNEHRVGCVQIARAHASAHVRYCDRQSHACTKDPIRRY